MNMTKKTAVIVIVITVCAAGGALLLKNSYVPDESILNANIISETVSNNISQDTQSIEEFFDLEQISPAQKPESSETEATVIEPSTKAMPAEYLKDPFLLLEDKSDTSDSLLGDIHRRNINALTTVLDNMTIKPGMRVSEIIDNSHWYTAREHDILQPGESGFLILENAFWSDESIKLVDMVARNGDIVFWVNNYSNTQAEIRDCVVYKYQISYLGCWDQFIEHPETIYYEKYMMGSGCAFDDPDEIINIHTDRGDCTRRYYGDDSTCEVLIDTDSDNNFIGLTVTCNKYYGPDFDKKR